MKHAVALLSLIALGLSPMAAASQACPEVLNHTLPLLHSSEQHNLCEQHKGKVLLIVNTASRCGFTPQLTGLEKLYVEHREKGFAVLGFPSNDFFQEFKSEEEVASFCRLNFGVSFPMYGISSVKGEGANPVYRELIAQSGQAPGWNFFKYLVDRSGKVAAVYTSQTTLDDERLQRKLSDLLSKGADLARR